MSRSPQGQRSLEDRGQYQAAWSAHFLLVRRGVSFSGRERNRVFLNTGRTRFANVSAATGFDFPDDGRAMSTVDWDHDGDLDVWLYNRTGPRLRLMLNNTRTAVTGDDRSFVALRLRSTTLNRDAIGARVEVQLENLPDARLIRTLYAGDAYLSQSSKWLHFGLGQGAQIGSVIVRWPGGETEAFSQVEAGGRYLLVQGTGKAEPWLPSERSVKLVASTQQPHKTTQAAHVRLPLALPMPVLAYTGFDDSTPRPIVTRSKPLLVNLWATWCPPCLGELKEFDRRREELQQAGLDILTISVDGFGEEHDTEPRDAQRLLDQMNFPFTAGVATEKLLEKLELVQDRLFDGYPPFAIPISYLLDGRGRLVAIYRGTVDIDQMLNDLTTFNLPPQQRRDLTVPIAGPWLGAPPSVNAWRVTLAEQLRDRFPQDSILLLDAALKRQVSRLEQVTGPPQLRERLSVMHARTQHLMADTLRHMDKLPEAVRHYRRALQFDPDYEPIHFNLGIVLLQLGLLDEAIAQLERLVDINPDYIDAYYNIAVTMQSQGRMTEAVAWFRQTVDRQPDYHKALNNLAWILATHADDDLRDPPEALRLAQQAAQLTGDSDPQVLDTLSVAQAATNRFDLAVETAKRAIALAEQDGDQVLGDEIRKRLQRFEQGQPYRAPAVAR